MARRRNPDLVVIAELFTASKEQDDMFCARLGLDYLIRESMSVYTPDKFAELIGAFCGDRVGGVESEFAQSCLAGALLMDASHDNPSLLEKRTIYDVLPTAAIGNVT